MTGLLITDGEVPDSISDLPFAGTLRDLDQLLVDQPVTEVFIVGATKEIVELEALRMLLLTCLYLMLTLRT